MHLRRARRRNGWIRTLRSGGQQGTVWLVAVSIIAGLALSGTARADPRRDGLVPHGVRYFDTVAELTVVTAAGGLPSGPQLVGASNAPLGVSFRTLDRKFELDVEPNDLFAVGAKNVWIDENGLVEEKPETFLYRGRLRQDPESWVRISLRDGLLDGMIFTPEDIFFVEPARRFFDEAGAGDMVAYRLSDTDSEWVPGSCAAFHGASELAGDAGFRSLHAGYAAARSAAAAMLPVEANELQEADIGIVADYEYFDTHGNQTATRMQGILNQVDGVFQFDVGVKLKVTNTIVYTNPNDPFTGVTSPIGLLHEFGAYKSSNDGSPGDILYGTDLAHLFTGRDLNGGVVGIAWIGALCDSYYATAVSQDLSQNKTRVLLAAHEIGHNFAAPHDNEPGSPCRHEPFGFIMNPYLNSDLDLEFSPCSKDRIAVGVAYSSCLETVDESPSPAPTETLTPTPSPFPSSSPTPSNTPTSTHTATVTPTATPDAEPATPTTPQNLATTSIGCDRISLTWDPSTSPSGILGYKLFRDGSWVRWVWSNRATDASLSESTSYTYTVVAVDNDGKESTPSGAVNPSTSSCSGPTPPPTATQIVPTPTFTETPDPGHTPTTIPTAEPGGPTAPQNLHATAIGCDRISLAWNVSAADAGILGYKLFRDGSWVRWVWSNQITNAGLSEATSYTYAVVAVDNDGNESAPSSAVNPSTSSCSGPTPTPTVTPIPSTPTFTETPDPGDTPTTIPTTEPGGPTVPQNLHATAIGCDRISLAWEVSAADAGILGYKLFRNGSWVRWVWSNHATDAGLSESTSYTYTVAARDNDGNESAPTAPAQYVTVSCSP